MPQEVEGGETPGSQRLTNDDFRKLLMTPRATPSSAPGGAQPGTIREAMARGSASSATPGASATPGTMPPPRTEDRYEQRRKRKSYYAKLKKQEDDKMAELAEKYRDRARERRDGANPDYQAEEGGNNVAAAAVAAAAGVTAASAYRAVAPDIKSGLDAAERRKQMIQESKFLGGDMEHTHLVKGLDYALLQKVRSEISTREAQQEAELEMLADGVTETERSAPVPPVDDQLQFRTRLGRSVHRVVCQLRSRHIERQELFAPGRMAYVVHLEGDEATGDTDIPTTLVRSKTEVPTIGVGSGSASTALLTTNDIVINKLAQILSYLRAGNRKGKKTSRRPGTTEIDRPTRPTAPADDSIYGDIGDYAPGNKSERLAGERPRSYFGEQPTQHDEEEDRSTPLAPTASSSRSRQLLSRLTAHEPEGYAECYPGLQEMQDAIDDSDDEVDYSKMDLGNKKGPIGRWDFDTAEEYSDYMNSKEALPKAAFQYGVKMADGRRSRKHKDKNERAELDREWQKIQNIIQKRKTPRPSNNSSTPDHPKHKQPRYQ